MSLAKRSKAAKQQAASERRRLEQALWRLGFRVGIHRPHRAPSVDTFAVTLGSADVKKLESKLQELAGRLGIESIRAAWQNEQFTLECARANRDVLAFADVLDALPRDGLNFPLGVSNTGRQLFADLSKLPHLLIAGSSGSGKSVFVHSLLCSLLRSHAPARLQLALHDAKFVELAAYRAVPHLLQGITNDAEGLMALLEHLCSEMDSRYKRFAATGARDIAGYKPALPRIVLLIDELADAVADKQARKHIEPLLVRLAQKARAAGIHLVLSTQRPSEQVMSTLLRVNIPARVAFSVADNASSRVILNRGGAELLLGSGDGLYVDRDSSITRFQSAFVSDEDIEQAVSLASEHEPLAGLPTASQDDVLTWLQRRDYVSSKDLFTAGFASSKSAAKILLQELREAGHVLAYDKSGKASPVVKLIDVSQCLASEDSVPHVKSQCSQLSPAEVKRHGSHA